VLEADWSAAKERLGPAPLIVEPDRTPAQRRADALVEMATRARTAPAGGRRPAPLFTVVVGLETLTGPVLELFNRTVLTPGTAALRRAIEVRDRTCFHPSCDEVPERLQIDHIHDASKGGETTQDNGQGGCGFHNRWKYSHPGSSDDDPDPDADPFPPFG